MTMDEMAIAIRSALDQAREDGRHREQMRIADWVRRLAEAAEYGTPIRIVLSSVATDIEGGAYAGRGPEEG